MITNYNQQNFGILSENLETKTGLSEVLVKNVEACEKIKKLVSLSYGPYGESKIIFQETGKILITADSSTILNNLNFVHPASKILLSSVFFQDQELGDSSGFVVIFAGELLNQALELLRIGFHSYEVIKSYQKAENVCLNILQTLPNYRLKNIRNLKSIISILLVTIGFKCQNIAKHLIPQIAYACIKISSIKNQKFSQEYLRVVKILGGPIYNTKTIAGTIILRDSENSVKLIKNAKVAIFSCSFDFLSPEIKTSIMFKNSKEILSFETTEKNLLEEKMKGFLLKGINVIIASGFNDEILDFLNRNEIMAIKVQSKFEIQRISLVTNATVLAKLDTPETDEIGYSDQVSVRSFGFQKVVIFYQESLQSNIFTIIARANCDSILNLIERFIYRTASVFKIITRDNRFIPGGGACEFELSRRLRNFSKRILSSKEKFIFNRFAACFEVFPDILIKNSKIKSSKLISSLHSKHENGCDTEGIDLDNKKTICSKKSGVWDHYSCKFWAIKNSLDSVLTILSVDQIIIARETFRN